jgi:anti-anti-sigma factor
VSSAESGPLAPAELAVVARTNRRTALVELRGELDLATVIKLAEVLSDLEPGSAGPQHVGLDLRGLSFIDVPGLRELMTQSDFARTNRHNLAVVSGTPSIKRVLNLSGVDEHLVLVDHPDDLVLPV